MMSITSAWDTFVLAQNLVQTTAFVDCSQLNRVGRIRLTLPGSAKFRKTDNPPNYREQPVHNTRIIEAIIQR